MEIKINRPVLFKSISRVQTILEKRSNMPILSMVHVSAVNSDMFITATDLEISLQQRIPCETLNPGSITISGIRP